MLNSSKVMAFIATADAARAKLFYQETLGLRLIADESFALVFETAGNQLRIQKVKQTNPPPFTVLGWEVPDIREAAGWLKGRGVVLERFESLPQDELGIWRAEDGAQVGWFRDPDGNLLSVTQFQ